ncbi:MAG: glycosyltransferase 87 family protein [Candidatus Kapaibacterium sp.]
MSYINSISAGVFRIVTHNVSRGRAVLIGCILCLYCLLPFAMSLITGNPVVAAMKYVGVMGMEPEFADTYNITTAIQSAKQGFDPLQQNPADVTARPMNYPRVWLLLGNLNITPEHSYLIAFGFIALFVVAMILVLYPLPIQQKLITLVAVCSPPVLLAVERGNNDLVIVSLIVTAIAMGSSKSVYPVVKTILQYVMLLCAAVLKLYPFVAIVSLLNFKDKRSMYAVLFCTMLFAVYCFVTLEDIRQIGKVVPAAISTSFGAMVIPDYILIKCAKFGVVIPQGFVKVITLVLCCVAPLFALRKNILNVQQTLIDYTTFSGRLWMASATIFCTVFVLGHNFDYRLVFLLLSLPQLFRWIEHQSNVASIVLSCIVLLLWMSFHISPQYSLFKDAMNMANELVAWVLFSLFGALLLRNSQPVFLLFTTFQHVVQSRGVSAPLHHARVMSEQ